MTSNWTIRLLGGLRVHSPEADHTRFRSRKTAALLAYLAYHLDRPHSREVLIEQFWPDAEPESARNSLSASLSSLRRQLEPPGTPVGGVLRASRETVQLHPEAVIVDAREFERLLQRALRARATPEEATLIQSALEWYGGPLLPGHYEEWTLTESQRLADLFTAAAVRLADLLEQEGAVAHALDLTLRAASLAPLDERVHQLCLRLLIHERDLPGAMRLYREFERRLREELDTVPSPELRALLSQASSPAGESTPPAVSRVDVPRPVPPRTTPRGVSSALLPPRFDRFFGRRQEFATLSEWFAPESETPIRLATLQGFGGSGKSRLAAEWARTQLEAYGGRVWFLTLTDETEGARFLTALSEGLRLPTEPGSRAIDRLAGFFDGKPGLLVLDNLEQLGEAAAAPIQALLTRVPALRIVVTSRTRLAIPGERVLEVDALPVPDEQENLDSAYQSPAVRLFVDRAQAAAPDFQLTPRTAPSVLSLCRRLEGIPLALELAASWAGTLSVTQLDERVSERLDLEARRPSGAPRNASLRATLGWSYGLLPEAARTFLARLSVFRGGWTVEAAAAVGESESPLPLLSQLRAHSFLTLDAAAEFPRYRMLETIREFAAEQLSPEAMSSLRRLHSDHFLDLSRQAASRWHSPEETEWHDRLDVDRDNLRVALDFSLRQPAGGSATGGTEFSSSLSRWWRVRGGAEEGLSYVEALLATASRPEQAELLLQKCLLLDALGRYSEMIDPAEAALAGASGDPQLTAQALFCLAEADEAAGRYADGTARLEQALALLRPLDDVAQMATCLNLMGLHLKNQRRNEEAQHAFAEALRHWERLGDRRGMAQVSGNLGLLAEDRGDFDEARRRAAEGLAHFEAIGDRVSQARALNNLGNDALRRDDPERARQCFEKSLVLRRQIGDRFGTSYALFGLGRLATARDDLNTAHSCLRECLDIFSAAEDPYGVAAVLHELARLEEKERSFSTALTLLLSARSLRSEAGAPYTEQEERALGERERSLRTRLSAVRGVAAENHAREMSFDEVVQWAFSLRGSPLRKHDAP